MKPVELGFTYAEPGDYVRIGRGSSAASILLVAGRSDHDWVLHGSRAAGIKRAHVENVNTLHFTEDFQTLQTSSLLEIGRNGTGARARAEKVFLTLDICYGLKHVSPAAHLASTPSDRG